MKLSKEALTALGLPEDASQEQINSAIIASKSPAPEGDAKEFSAALEKTKHEVTSTFKAELDKRDAEIAELRASKSDSDAKVKATQVEVVLSEMSREMRFTPAERDDLVTLGNELGPDRLRDMLSKRPSLSHLSQESGKGDRTPKDKNVLSAVELKTAEKLGLSPDEMRKAKAVMSSDNGRFSAGFISKTVRPKDDEDDSEAA